VSPRGGQARLGCPTSPDVGLSQTPKDSRSLHLVGNSGRLMEEDVFRRNGWEAVGWGGEGGVKDCLSKGWEAGQPESAQGTE
jgi:hypothetical protein